MASRPEAQPGPDPADDPTATGASDTNPADPDPPPATDEQRLAAYARDLVDRTEAVIADWVQRCVAHRARDADHALDDELTNDARRAGEQARAEMTQRLQSLVDQDIDAQATNPMSILRGAVRYPTEVLIRAGVPPVDRDTEARRIFPDDHYDLTPTAFADIDPSLHEPGLLWGAAKAHIHLSRRRAEGRR